MHTKSRSVFTSLTITAFVMVGTLGVGRTIVLASEPTLYLHPESNFFQLRLEGNKLSGHFVNRPLLDVLDAISRQSNFQYQGSEVLLNYPISGSFDGIATTEALKQILKPFDYLLVIGSTGEPQRVFLTDVKTKSENDVGSDVFDPVTGKELLSTDAIEDSDHTEGEHVWFEVLEDNASLPPEFDMHTNVPSFKNEFPGQPFAEANDQDPSEFEPIVNATGPDIPNLKTVEFPEFEPYYREEGPITPK